MRYFLLCFSFFIPLINAYAEEIYPPACKPFAIEGNAATLPAGKPRLIMLHNLSGFDLWVTHPLSEKDNHTGMSTRLQANNWSALALNDSAFEISCIESKPGHEQQVSCKEALAICEWHTKTRPKDRPAIFWAAENMPLAPLTAYLGRTGFELP